ncbi:MAG: efflux transporter outer membrane subunit [Planctomycetota bacterium]
MLLALAVPVLASCSAVGPDYSPPRPPVPDKWHEDLTDGLATGTENLHTWWKTLQDPTLEKLIERAARGNKSLGIAVARVREAHAVRGVALGEGAIDMDGIGFWERRRFSEGIMGVTIPPLSRTDNIGGLGVDASWELDFWGRIFRTVQSADASFHASVENYRDTLVILFAEVATTYVDVRSLQARIQYVESNIDNQRGTLKLTKDRLDAQIAPELDVRQAELNLARTESVLPRLRQLLARAIYRLGVLVGEHPGTLWKELSEQKPIPILPEKVAVGVPRDVVRQRPDLRRAERNLAAQTARIGVATAARYPSFSLFGSFAYEADSDLFDAKNRAWSFGPAFRWNLFDGGRVENSILIEDAGAKAALVEYERAVLRALEEVENAIAGYVQELKRSETLTRSVTAAELSVGHVKTLYRTGLTDFQNVLDMERSLFVQQDELADSRGRVVKNLIKLYKALGGGWNPPRPQPAKKQGGKPTGKEPDKQPGKPPDKQPAKTGKEER